jgi:hypothetical protein
VNVAVLVVGVAEGAGAALVEHDEINNSETMTSSPDFTVSKHAITHREL